MRAEDPPGPAVDFRTAESAIMVPVVISSIFGLITISFSLKKVTGVKLFSFMEGKFNRKLIYYSLPIMFMSILGTVLHWTDVFMLGYFTDTSTVGLYHPAARTAGIIRMVLLSFAGIYGPIMAEIFFETDNLIFEVRNNSAISDVADEKNASLPFGCREGQCGTCRVMVIKGMENLNEVEDEEKLALEDS